MADLDNLVLSLVFDNKKLKDSSTTALKTIDDMAKQISSKLEGAFKVLLGGAGLDFTKNLVENFANAGSRLEFLSQTLRTNVSGLATWEQAVKRTGGSAETFASTVLGVYDKINNAAVQGDMQTMGILQGVLKVNPLDAKGNRKDILVLIKEIGGALRSLPQNLQRPIGKQLGFDDATLRLLMMNNAESAKLFENIGKIGVMSDQNAKQATALRNSWLDVSQTWEIIGIKVVTNLMPAIEKFTQLAMKFVSFLSSHKDEVTGVMYAIIGVSALMIAANPFTPWLVVLTALIAGMHELKAQLRNVYDMVHGNATPRKAGEALATFLPIPITEGTRRLLRKGWDALTNAQALKESGGRSNAIGGYNESELTYGTFQERLSTARMPESQGGLGMSLGHIVTAQDLMNPAIAKRARDAYFNYGSGLAQKSMPMTSGALQSYQQLGAKKFYELGALAFYNGGYKGLEYWKNTGHTFNGYGESILAKAAQLSAPKILPGAGNLQSQTKGSASAGAANSNLTIHNLNLPNVLDHNGFIHGLEKLTKHAWSFSSSGMA